jgi:hypothetical protein
MAVLNRVEMLVDDEVEWRQSNSWERLTSSLDVSADRHHAAGVPTPFEANLLDVFAALKMLTNSVMFSGVSLGVVS